MFNQFKTALTNVMKKPATVGFPFEPSPTPTEYRGVIGYSEEQCIFCMKCEDVCPPGCILFDQELEDGKMTYHYNPYLCIYCGECVRACPKPGKEGAMWQEEQTSPPCADRAMNDDWFVLEKQVEENRAAYKAKKAAEKAAAAKAKAATAEAVKTEEAKPADGATQ